MKLRRTWRYINQNLKHVQNRHPRHQRHRLGKETSDAAPRIHSEKFNLVNGDWFPSKGQENRWLCVLHNWIFIAVCFTSIKPRTALPDPSSLTLTHYLRPHILPCFVVGTPLNLSMTLTIRHISPGKEYSQTAARIMNTQLPIHIMGRQDDRCFVALLFSQTKIKGTCLLVQNICLWVLGNMIVMLTFVWNF